MTTHSRTAQSPTVGIIYPGHAAEDDYPAFESSLKHHHDDAGSVRLPVVISTIGVDEHTAAALLETGSHARLSEATQRLQAEHQVDSIMWACTSEIGRASCRERVEVAVTDEHDEERED